MAVKQHGNGILREVRDSYLSVKRGHTVALQMNDIQFELAKDMHWKTNGEDKYQVAT